MKRWLTILIVVCILLTTSSVKADREITLPKTPEGDIPTFTLPETPEGEIDWNEITKRQYKDFLNIKVFFKSDELSGVHLVGDAEKIGLDEKALGDYLKLRIKNNFADIKSEKVEDFVKYTGKQFGSINLRIWVLGDDYPIYHLRCQFWNLDYLGGCWKAIWNTEFLGHASKETIHEQVKKGIDEMIEELAILFYKVRGEL